nr:hypothetical protein [Actinoplanes utahensis]
MTGKTYFTFAGFVVALALGDGLALLLAFGVTDGETGADVPGAFGGIEAVVGGAAAEDCAAGSTNCGVEAGEADPPVVDPQPVRPTATIVNPERVRSKRTATSWQKTGDRAGPCRVATLQGSV